MAQKQVAWNSGAGYIKLTYTGSGNGNIIVDSDENNLGTARSQVVTVQTVDGTKSVNLTVRQGANPFPVGKVQNFSYTGDYEEIELPAGKYKLQCWGAQGGSNAAAPSYGITAQAGGKGGYSEGIITLSQKTTIRAYVGGQGSSSAGGFNGGGSTSGSASYNSGNEQGVSRMGGGGGATDIRLSDGALLSRMIVAGGGSGGAMCYKETTIESWETKWSGSVDGSGWTHTQRGANDWLVNTSFGGGSSGTYFDYGKTVRITYNGSQSVSKIWLEYYVGSTWKGYSEISNGGTVVIPNYGQNIIIVDLLSTQNLTGGTVIIENLTSSTITDTNSQVGYVGGGTTGGGYSSTYQGKQNAAGSGGSFGQGANQTATNYRYCSGAGGGGWYGGGGGKSSDSDMNTCKQSGGGSGFVNTAASAGNRPSGYTGLQLDSGETKDGNTSFPSTGGGTEIGHSGNGYARITRIE